MPIRRVVDVLVRDRNSLENCDEGAAKKHCRVALEPVPLEDGRRIRALHISWRQATTVSQLTPEEAQLLIAVGYNVKVTDDQPYVHILEKRNRHRWVVLLTTGWVTSTAERPDNIQELSPLAFSSIPSLSLSKREELLVGVHEMWWTLREDLKIHGTLPEFYPMFDRIFGLLANLFEETMREPVPAQPEAQPRPAESIPMGRVSVSAAKR